MSDPHDLRELEKDPRLFLYTSLTAGSSHIITATSRLETILKANRVPFQAIDVATDEKARRLWQRRAGKKKLPGLVKDGFVIGDLEEVEEWNEYGELKENIGTVPGASAPVPAPKLPVVPTATAGTTKVTAPDPLVDMPKRVALPGAAEIAARNNPLPKSSPEEAAHPETKTSAPAEKEKSIERAIKFKGEEKQAEHLDVPTDTIPATTPTPAPEKIEEDAVAGAEASDEVAEVKESASTSIDSKPLPISKDVGPSDADEATIQEAATVSVEEDVKASAGPAGDAVEKKAADTAVEAPSQATSQSEPAAAVPKNIPVANSKSKSVAEGKPEPAAAKKPENDTPTTKSETSVQDASVNDTVASKPAAQDATDAVSAQVSESASTLEPAEQDEPAKETVAVQKEEPAEATKTPAVNKENVLPLLPPKDDAGADTQLKQEKSLPSLPKEADNKSEAKPQETQKQAAAKPELAAESVED